MVARMVARAPVRGAILAPRCCRRNTEQRPCARYRVSRFASLEKQCRDSARRKKTTGVRLTQASGVTATTVKVKKRGPGARARKSRMIEVDAEELELAMYVADCREYDMWAQSKRR